MTDKPNPLLNLADALVDDLMDTPDEELLAEFDDPKAIADEVRRIFKKVKDEDIGG